MDNNNFKLALEGLMQKDVDELLTENEPFEFSRKFERKMRKLIKKQRRFYFPLVKTPLRLSFTVIVMVILMTVTTMMSVGAVREAIFNFFINTFSTHSDITAIDDDQHPDIIEEIYEIGYDLSEYYVDFKTHTDYENIIIYKNPENYIIKIEQYTKKNFDIGINTENADIKYIDLNGYDVIYFLDNHKYNHLIWDNGKYVFKVSSNLSKEETFEIAKSVRKSE